MYKAGEMQSGMRVAAMAGALSLAAICAAQTQSSGSGQMPSGTRQTGGNNPLGPAGALDPGSSPFPDNSRLRRNDERQRRLVSDTQKLLALTTQLKAEVATTGAETMSPEMLKQMEEIEKLAKSVKDKMRD